MLKFSRQRFGDDWLDSATTAYCGSADGEISEHEAQLLIPWAIYHLPAGERGISVARHFREENARRLSRDERDIIDAQLQSWLSIWEIREVVPGVGMSLVDMLTGEECFVHEISGSADANPRDALLMLITTAGEVSFGSGTHPQPLAPRDSARVAREIRRICRVRTKPIGTDRLRDVNIQIKLIHVWRDEVERARMRPPPKLTNTDGDELILTTDHFDILGSDHSALLSRLVMLPGASEPEPDEHDKRETVIVMTKAGNARMKSWDNTIIGRIIVRAKRLQVETNSTRRADTLRDLLTSELGDLLRYRLRSDVSQEELRRTAMKAPTGQTRKGTEMAPDLTALVREFRERHMLGWLDEEIPALGGLTPRAAAVSPRSREALELLLREFENHEARLPAGERFDIDRLRTELDMP
ncbi:MAG: hypothetical protein ACSLFK_12055, partial [Gemmatimonadaceae bacterium]